MLLTLAIYHLYRASPARALPFASPTSARELLSAAESSCQALGQCRSIWDIVWSCLVTIFSCTWVAIHPNIPSPKDSWLKRTGRRVGITLMALIAPELVILWAMRQWTAAREFRDMYRERGWTMTHGFFAIMGGFMLYDEHRPKQVLLPEKLKELADNGTIDFPNITKGEVQDRSKGDLLSKGLVILQTTWFVVQCGARGIEGLPLTELEIVTLAYAAVNFVTYAIWWSKPLNVQYAYRVQMKLGPESDKAKEDVAETPTDSDSLAESKQHGGYDPLLDGPGIADDGGRTPSLVERYFDGSDGIGMFFDVVAVPVAPFITMALGSYSDYRHPLRVPTFSSGTEKGVSSAVSFGAAAVATGFGAIHCIAWSFEFPSSRELLFWRISSVAITGIPLCLLLAVVIINNVQFDEAFGVSARHGGCVRGLFYVISSALALVLMAWVAVCLVAGTLYVVARLDILAQAFVSLRALPEGVFETVSWTTFIPHI